MKLKFFGLMSALLFLLFSCKPAQVRPAEKELHTITKTITEYKRDTVVKVQADSAIYEALVECRNGKPVLVETKTPGGTTRTKQGKNLKTAVTLGEDGKLKVRADYFENLYKLTLRDKQILLEKLKEKQTIMPPKMVEKDLTWWQTTQIWFGRLALLGLVIFIVKKLPWRVSFGL